jgi:hypothetical protein
MNKIYLQYWFRSFLELYGLESFNQTPTSIQFLFV